MLFATSAGDSLDSIKIRNGIKYLEIPHLFTQWGAKAAPKIVVTVDGKNIKKFGWHTPALDSSYQSFLKQFLPELQSKLIEFGYDRDHVFFHIRRHERV